MTSHECQVNDNVIVYSTACLNWTTKKTAMLRTLPFCDVNAPMIDGFPSQRASSAGIVSMPWRYDKILQIIRVLIATPPISQNLSYKLHAIFRVFNGINILRRYDEVNSSFILMHHTCHGLVATWRPAAWGWFSCQECYRPESKNPPITWNPMGCWPPHPSQRYFN